MKYIDAHAHLSSSFYKSIGEVEQLYNKAVELGVDVIINTGTNMASSRMVISDKARLPKTHPAVGIHPLDIDNKDNDFDELESLASNNDVVGIGEIGLDLYYKDAPSIENQKRGLMKQLDISLRVYKPVILHVRDAFDEIIEILNMPKYRNLTGIVHTFSGNLEQARFLVERGFMLSFSGVITFKNSEEVRTIISKLPITALLSETDSPFLTPVPKRGQRNYPLNVVFVVAEMANIRQISVNEMINAIANNIEKLFGIK